MVSLVSSYYTKSLRESSLHIEIASIFVKDCIHSIIALSSYKSILGSTLILHITVGYIRLHIYHHSFKVKPCIVCILVQHSIEVSNHIICMGLKGDVEFPFEQPNLGPDNDHLEIIDGLDNLAWEVRIDLP